MQPLPVLMVAQVKLVGPTQPAGNELNPAVIDRSVAVAPSSVTNVTLNGALNPTVTLRTLVVEGMATTLSLLYVEVSGYSVLTTRPHAANNAKLTTMAEQLTNFGAFVICLMPIIVSKERQGSNCATF
jgi:hypothetical protein